MQENPETFNKEFEIEYKTSRYNHWNVVLENFTREKLLELYSKVDESTFTEEETKRNTVSKIQIY